MSGQETRVTRISDLSTLEVGGDACLVCIYGPVLGRKWPISEQGATLAIGRGPQNDIVLDLDNVSRRHCEFNLRDGQVYANDLGSTNGTFVNGAEVRGDTELANGDHVKVGGAIFKFITGGNIESLYHEEIYRMTIVDGLTQIHNKRYLLESIEREMARCSRFGRPLHLLMFDVDHFKNLNDTYGHIAGDAVLRDLAAMIDKTVRREEIFARYGGEEFALVIPEVDAEKVTTYAEKMRQMVADHHFIFEGQRMAVTISVGVAPMPDGCEDPQAFIQIADERLYAAKRGGRNRVVAA